MKHKSRKPLWIALACVLVIAVAAVCLWFFWLRGLWGPAGADPVYVESVADIAGLNTGSIPRYSGVVESQDTYDIKKDDSKTVAEIYVAEGDQVTVGTPLFRYDTQQMEMDLQQAELDLESISNRITTLENQKKDLQEEKKNASKDEQYSYTVQIQSVELQIKTEEYNSDVKKNDISQLQSSIQNAEVYSEVDGMVKEINETSQTDASGQQKPFLSILAGGDFRVKGTVSELNMGSLYAGQAVTVHSRVDETMVWQGVIDSIESEPTSDTNNNNMGYYGMDSGQQSSKYNFFVTLSSMDGLILGQHVYIQPDLGNGSTLSGLCLPAFYIAHDDEGSYVWAQGENGTLEQRRVMLGEYDSSNDRYQIQEGLTEEDFIAYPEEGLEEGMPTTTSSSLVTDGTEDPTVDDGTTDPNEMDPNLVDPNMGTVDGGMPMEVPMEEGTSSPGEDNYADDGEGVSSDSLDGSPMEGLAR